jgi:hypothetical protein
MSDCAAEIITDQIGGKSYAQYKHEQRLLSLRKPVVRQPSIEEIMAIEL